MDNWSLPHRERILISSDFGAYHWIEMMYTSKKDKIELIERVKVSQAQQ